MPVTMKNMRNRCLKSEIDFGIMVKTGLASAKPCFFKRILFIINLDERLQIILNYYKAGMNYGLHLD